MPNYLLSKDFLDLNDDERNDQIVSAFKNVENGYNIITENQ